MAGASLLALLDDIATILDDVGALTKVATEKTAGVLGDDLALNAEQVSGVDPARELPVVWAVAKGSAVNKLILVPSALAISAVTPWMVMPLLMFGGAFLCYEGAHKLVEKLTLDPAEAEARRKALRNSLTDPAVDLVQAEKDKIQGAIRTDFILSAEIIAITLGTVATESIGMRIAVLSVIAVIVTVGVYGLVAGIVKLDDAGANLVKRPGSGAKRVGVFILAFAPKLMRFLAIAGTIAMFMVGGGILVHGLPPVADAVARLAGDVGTFGWIAEPVANALFGVLAGLIAYAILTAGAALYRKLRA